MFELVLNGLNLLQRLQPVSAMFELIWTGLYRFKPVATGYNRLLQCLNWFEQVYIGLNRL